MDLGEIDSNDWEAINLPKYSRFVAIPAGRNRKNSGIAEVNVQIATVEVPAKIMIERLVGRHKYIWIYCSA